MPDILFIKNQAFWVPQKTEECLKDIEATNATILRMSSIQPDTCSMRLVDSDRKSTKITKYKLLKDVPEWPLGHCNEKMNFLQVFTVFCIHSATFACNSISGGATFLKVPAYTYYKYAPSLLWAGS